MPNYYPVKMEFHVSRQSRDRYQFDESLFSTSGNVIFANFHASRVFAQKMNAKRDLVRFPEQVVRAGQINAMGLIDEILHVVVGQYRQQRNPQVMERALVWLNENIGPEAVDKVLRQFVEEFPPLAVYRREMSLDEYLAGVSDLPGVYRSPTGRLCSKSWLCSGWPMPTRPLPLTSSYLTTQPWKKGRPILKSFRACMTSSKPSPGSVLKTKT